MAGEVDIKVSSTFKEAFREPQKKNGSKPYTKKSNYIFKIIPETQSQEEAKTWSALRWFLLSKEMAGIRQDWLQEVSVKRRALTTSKPSLLCHDLQVYKWY